MNLIQVQLGKKEKISNEWRLFHLVLEGQLLGGLRIFGCRPQLGNQMFDLVADPLLQETERARAWLDVLAACNQSVSQVIGCELEKVEDKNGKGDEIQQDACGSEQLAGVVFRIVLVFEHGSRQRRHLRYEQGRQFESVEDSEIFAIGRHQNLRYDGNRDQMRDASDRQRAVEEVGAKHEECDAGLSRDDGDLPEPTSVQSVGAIEKPHRLERPAALVRQVRG